MSAMRSRIFVRSTPIRNPRQLGILADARRVLGSLLSCTAAHSKFVQGAWPGNLVIIESPEYRQGPRLEYESPGVPEALAVADPTHRGRHDSRRRRRPDHDSARMAAELRAADWVPTA